MPYSTITGIGSYLPEKILTNADLEKMVDTNDEWITTRTGIKERHIAAEEELTSHMSTKAANHALEKAGISAEAIDLIIVATTTPDQTFPATAAKVQEQLGVKSGAIAFDVQAVCAGFVYALTVADSFIRTGQVKNALVIGAEKMSSIVDWTDRNTCVLFGDGAGAAVVQTTDSDESAILATKLHTDGNLANILYADGGVASTGTAGKIHMQGKEVFKHATHKMASCVEEVLDIAGLKKEDIDWLVPHQANIRILEAVAKKLKLPEEKVISTVSEHANTSAASIPLALDVACQKNQFNKGDVIVLDAIGGGLSWGACLLRW